MLGVAGDVLTGGGALSQASAEGPGAAAGRLGLAEQLFSGAGWTTGKQRIGHLQRAFPTETETHVLGQAGVEHQHRQQSVGIEEGTVLGCRALRVDWRHISAQHKHTI